MFVCMRALVSGCGCYCQQARLWEEKLGGKGQLLAVPGGMWWKLQLWLLASVTEEGHLSTRSCTAGAGHACMCMCVAWLMLLL